MESNVNTPWGAKMSPPSIPELHFYSPDSADLLFAGGGEIAIHCAARSRCVGLVYSVSRNGFATPFLEGRGEALPENMFVLRVPTANLYPGFYDIKVWLDTGTGSPLESVCVFGYRAGNMKVRETRPSDFAEFWSRSKKALTTIPPDVRLGEMTVYSGRQIDDYNRAHAALPGDYDPEGHRAEAVESCKFTFASVAGTRIHGWLAKPVGNGPFPAMLVLPGGGIASRPRPLEHARHGYLALDIQIHGHDVDLAKYPRVPGYDDEVRVFDPVENFYFRNVYLHGLQALNCLAAHPEVDPMGLVVVGGSQGGRLSVVLAALDQRVAAAVPAIAHFGNVIYQEWATACSSADLNGMDAEIPPPLGDAPSQRCLPYYDVMNFAPDVKCPVLMNMGLIDPVSLATGVWAIYQRIASEDKLMVPLPGMAHDWSAEFDRRAWRWLAARLGR